MLCDGAPGRPPARSLDGLADVEIHDVQQALVDLLTDRTEHLCRVVGLLLVQLDELEIEPIRPVVAESAQGTHDALDDRDHRGFDPQPEATGCCDQHRGQPERLVLADPGFDPHASEPQHPVGDARCQDRPGQQTELSEPDDDRTARAATFTGPHDEGTSGIVGGQAEAIPRLEEAAQLPVEEALRALGRHPRIVPDRDGILGLLQTRVDDLDVDSRPIRCVRLASEEHRERVVDHSTVITRGWPDCAAACVPDSGASG